MALVSASNLHESAFVRVHTLNVAYGINIACLFTSVFAMTAPKRNGMHISVVCTRLRHPLGATRSRSSRTVRVCDDFARARADFVANMCALVRAFFSASPANELHI